MSASTKMLEEVTSRCTTAGLTPKWRYSSADAIWAAMARRVRQGSGGGAVRPAPAPRRWRWCERVPLGTKS
uniref:Uncharacterized protein n=1 Tax=Arundo donax TaxID=35708 RepID=A0A0A8ZYS4_ARUDO